MRRRTQKIFFLPPPPHPQRISHLNDYPVSILVLMDFFRRPDVYADLVDMKSSIFPDSAIVTIRDSGLGYWVEFVEDSEVLDIMQMSGDACQSYPAVHHSTLYVGNVYALIEFIPPPNRFPAPPL